MSQAGACDSFRAIWNGRDKFKGDALFALDTVSSDLIIDRIRLKSNVATLPVLYFPSARNGVASNKG